MAAEPGYRLFEKEPEEETARTDFRKKFLSVTLPRDLPYGGGKPPNYHLGAEVYHPNFCARQLGCPQLIPLKSYRSYALYPSWEPNSCCSADFEAWWKARFRNLPASSTALAVLFDGWDGWVVHTGEETHKFMVQTIKDINAQVLEDPFLTQDVGGQSAQGGEVFAGSPSPPPTKSKRLRKRTVVVYVATEGTAAAPTSTYGTDDELREAFEAVEQEKELEALKEVGERPQEKPKTVEEEQEKTRAELTSSELAFFENPEAEQSTAAPATEERADQSASEPVDQTMIEVPRSAGVLAAVTSPLKPPIVAMPIHSLPGSSATASFAYPELAEFEAMDLDAQLDKLEKLSSPPGKAKSRAVEEAMERLKI
ncbi:unnamed protein product [Prunus brigantina]